MLFNTYIDGIVSHTWPETAVPPLADDISDGQSRVLPLATIPFPDVRARLQMTNNHIINTHTVFPFIFRLSSFLPFMVLKHTHEFTGPHIYNRKFNLL